ncbi:MAG: hypothetical protein AAFQ98_14270, partial [Bacteroidota bacterium]
MRNLLHLFGLGVGVIFCWAFLAPEAPSQAPRKAADRRWQDSTAESLKAFQTLLKVLKDPRCLNCHPTGDRPRQGDDQHLHLFNIVRGPENQGGPVTTCNSCHQAENNPYSQVPGAPHWGLAPKSMGWYGLSDVEIGQRLVDPERNGGRTPQQLVEHMTTDDLVLWGWDPGKGRQPVQVPFEEFKTAPFSNQVSSAV